jgi:Tat protein secretion system quality control protein TatD with DNase activity
MVESFVKVPHLKNRIFFSFSYVINMNAPKTSEVIAAVPEDKLMIESDQNTPLYIDSDMLEIVQVVSLAKGWTPDEVAQKTYRNTLRFLEPVMKKV